MFRSSVEQFFSYKSKSTQPTVPFTISTSLQLTEAVSLLSCYEKKPVEVKCCPQIANRFESPHVTSKQPLQSMNPFLIPCVVLVLAVILGVATYDAAGQMRPSEFFHWFLYSALLAGGVVTWWLLGNGAGSAWPPYLLTLIGGVFFALLLRYFKPRRPRHH